jgi:hypothetical protein
MKMNEKKTTHAQKQRNKLRLVWLAAVMLAALSILVLPAFAGGWATVTIDSLPEVIEAGETARIEFTILQHGQTPVHTLSFGGETTPLTPVVTASLGATTLEFEALPLKQTGRWFVDVTLPEAGSWNWAIMPAPLAGATELKPLVVEAAAPAPVTSAAVDMTPLVIGAALAALALVGFVLWRGRKTAVVA